MKTTLIMSLGLFTTPAIADDLTFYTGKEGGGYHGYSKDVVQRLNQYGVGQVSIENRNGSDDITLQACSNDNSLWVAQVDAIWTREMKQGCYLEVLADYGNEYTYLMFPPDSEKSKLGHLDSSSKILVDRIGSGSELTWKNMVFIDQEHGGSDDWGKAKPVTSDIRRASALANKGDIDAVFLVRTPSSSDIGRLIDQGWSIGKMSDKDINDLMYGSKPLYEKADVQFEGCKKCYNDGYVVRSVVGTTEHMESRDADLFYNIMDALNN